MNGSMCRRKKEGGRRKKEEGRRMEGWKDGRMEGWKDGRMDGKRRRALIDVIMDLYFWH